MKKKIIGITIVLGLLVGIPLYAAGPDALTQLITILAKSTGLQNQYLEQIAQNTSPKLGNAGSRSLRLDSSATATTSPTYFGVGLTETATTTLLTVGCDSNVVKGPLSLADIDTLGVYLQATASTSGSVVLIRPQVSLDCVDWYDMAWYDQVTTAGSAVNAIVLPTATSTFISWTPTNTSLQFKSFVLRNLAAKAVRFRVSAAVASSSLWMSAASVDRITR